MMRILTLFLALFLTLLPESVPSVSTSYEYDVCLEEMCDAVEEEAILRAPQRVPKINPASSDTALTADKPVSTQVLLYHPVRFCSERPWLVTCTLRL